MENVDYGSLLNIRTLLLAYDNGKFDMTDLEVSKLKALLSLAESGKPLGTHAATLRRLVSRFDSEVLGA